MAVFTLTVVRHGETVANRQSVLQGQKDTLLSETGFKQARLLGCRLQNEKFTHVFASDLGRAIKTAQTILEYNKYCRCEIAQDARLRERKFGIFEGRPSREFWETAKKENTTVPTYVPPGGETIHQVRHRATLFFQELCQQLQQAEKAKESEGGVKRRRHGSLVSSSYGGSSTGSAAEVKVEVETDTTTGSHQTQTESECDDSNSNLGHSTSSSTSGCSSLTDNADASSPDAVFPDDSAMNNSSHLAPMTTTTTTVINTPLFPQSALVDSDIKSHISGDQDLKHGCPNVSLSPLFEHRLSSLSSVSSGRNSSFDDGDSLPVLIADVLVVSHGGFLKEMIKHFMEDLGCKIPGGKGHALRVSPNTGISKFTVTLSEGEEKPRLTCLSIHDKDHLLNKNLEPLVPVLDRCDDA